MRDAIAYAAEKDVLFVGGKNSNYIQEEDFATITEFFPTAEIEMISGAGHWLHAEKPEEFLSITQSFLKK